LKFIDGLTAGVTEYMPKITESVRKLGKAIIDGLVNEITSGVGRVVDAVIRLGERMLEALFDVFDSASPSKETAKIGGYFVMGLIVGMNGLGDRVELAAREVGNKALRGLTSVTDTMSEILNANMDLAPTIRPVLDLTDIQVGKKTIGDLLGNTTLAVSSSNTAAKVSSNLVGSNGNNQNGSIPLPGKETQVSFVQNNYSPKALSRIEIYRQTRNQLLTMKGLVGNI